MTADLAAEYLDNLAVVDVETTRLDPVRPDNGGRVVTVWELAVAFPWHAPPLSVFVRPDLEYAEPAALEVGRFAERYVGPAALSTRDAREWLEDQLGGRRNVRLGGSLPSFDAGHLAASLYPPILRPDGPPWRHHHLDVPAYVAGAFGRPDAAANLAASCEVAGIPYAPELAHTAAGDVDMTADALAAAIAHQLDLQVRARE